MKISAYLLQGLLALSPLAVFLVLYLVTSLVIGDFYKMPITVAFVATCIYAIAILNDAPLKDRLKVFSQGAGDANIMLMIWIFILAGAFAGSATDMGSIQATVDLSLFLLPDSLIAAGLFLGACLISLSIGTSVGTIVALVPIASGIAQATGASTAFVTAIVVGGAFFGDNLSFISDTTIAATRTQGCNMTDKFKTNLRIVLPAAIIVFIFYLFYGLDDVPVDISASDIDFIKILPYLIVLITAIMGVDVTLVLLLGIISTGAIGMLTNSYDSVFGWVASMGTGISNMSELIIITLLAGGLISIIRYYGGIDFLITTLTKNIKGQRGAELSIAGLVSIANICTANNTIAILTVGPLAAEICKRYKVDSRKSASILDTFSCVVQGVLPYGAQLLMAASLAAISPISIISYLYYPMVLLICAILGIIIKNPNRK